MTNLDTRLTLSYVCSNGENIPFAFTHPVRLLHHHPACQSSGTGALGCAHEVRAQGPQLFLLRPENGGERP